MQQRSTLRASSRPVHPLRLQGGAPLRCAPDHYHSHSRALAAPRFRTGPAKLLKLWARNVEGFSSAAWRVLV